MFLSGKSREHLFLFEGRVSHTGQPTTPGNRRRQVQAAPDDAQPAVQRPEVHA